ncbi:DUF4190 domain-containing protein [Streptomyces sp. NP160]|uniref:DUF4190 domain-containing protein n=1 Tax=Streptomyces sp. NP160 TaxID=2586637 RepID=UPI00111A93B9|nr:DUF4190 domain-containing protein [Streptomyces sp. NP160]TNM64576.1 DUF4190 domain-containing protein [Streptomyces sp. NP160]
MSTQDPYGTSDQPPRTGSSASGPSGSQPSWQQSAPAGPQQGYPAAPQQGYPAYAGQGGYDRPAPKNGVGLAALIIGILALLLSFTVFGGIILGLVAIVLGIIGARRVKRGLATNRGASITGVVLGVLGLMVSIAFIALGAFFFSQTADCNQYIESNDQAGYQQCLESQLGGQGS